jgi:uncharacterized protein (TIGR03435 family)
MFERYSEEARRVLFYAQYEATRLGSVSIETAHLLLGLIREGPATMNRIFTKSHLPLEEIRKKLAGGVATPEAIVAGDPPQLPFSAETKRVLHLAAEEADRLLHNRIIPEHLLLGILREERSVAASILTEHGLRLDKVRDDIVLLLHEETTIPRSRGGRPDVPPSYNVHISPTAREEEQGTLGSAAGDYWMRLGYELKPIIAEVYGVDESRIDVPPALDDGSRYDFVLVLPKPEGLGTIENLVQHAIQEHFHLVIARETRSIDVYVVTAPNGVKAAKLLELGGGGIMTSFRDFQVDTRVRPLPAMRELIREAFSSGQCGVFGSGTTIADFCKGLEQNLGRLFVDETGLTGIYDHLELRADDHRFEDVLQALRDQLGLVATRERRDVTMLVARVTR